MTNPNYLSIQSVAITGGLGNLGTKLFRHLAGLGTMRRLVGLDVRPAAPDHAANLLAGIAHPPVLEFVTCDFADYQDRCWRDVIEQVDAVVHFAAQNPYPEATWEEAAISLDMTLHIANAAVESKQTKRVVFATSNHVMGRYKDDPLWASIGPGELTTALPPSTGTLWHTGEQALDSTPYATAKLMGERVCKAAAGLSQGNTTFACVRIGWCQPGENLPTTLSAAGTPTQTSAVPATVDAADYARADRWFKEMWLSNRDFLQLFERAILIDGGEWPTGYILVNGMSNNRGMKWSLAETQRWLNYQPLDDVYQA
ncbi:MAG: NAD-dependent epimerase/dehydratase family protein [Caldilineaceae bacterium]